MSKEEQIRINNRVNLLVTIQKDRWKKESWNEALQKGQESFCNDCNLVNPENRRKHITCKGCVEKLFSNQLEALKKKTDITEQQ